MKIGLLTKYAVDHGYVDTVFEVAKFFIERSISVSVDPNHAKMLNFPPITPEVDYLISLGGDGTILSYAHKYLPMQVPLVGINLGHLGFMADIPMIDLIPSLNDLIEKKFSIEKRLVLEGKTESFSSIAVNDFVLHRGQKHSLIEFAIYVDDLYLNTFEADGMIIASPNGSTAYSLAAGGPILTPSLEAIVLTPISPHTISNRPIVISSDSTIKIEYLQPDPIELIADGIDRSEINPNNVITIKKSSLDFKLINLNRRDFYSILRSKLGWSGKLRRSLSPK